MIYTHTIIESILWYPWVCNHKMTWFIHTPSLSLYCDIAEYVIIRWHDLYTIIVSWNWNEVVMFSKTVLISFFLKNTNTAIIIVKRPLWTLSLNYFCYVIIKWHVLYTIIESILWYRWVCNHKMTWFIHHDWVYLVISLSM